MFVQLGRGAHARSRRCRASSGCRSRTRSRRPARRTRSASRRCCCSACRPRRTSRAPAPTTTRASSSSPCARIKDAHPDLLVITDVCLCAYTSHGHCGVVREDGTVDNDLTLELLAKTAISHAARGRRRRGAQRHDGRPRGRAPRAARRRGLTRTCRSSPTRRSSPRPSTARSARRPTRRRRSATGAATRWIPANADEAVREALLDVEEGADVVMVKPALPYLDVIRRVKDATRVPVAAYNVSGEYAMLKAAAARRLPRRARDRARGAHRDPPRRRRHRHHLPRQGRGPSGFSR